MKYQELLFLLPAMLQPSNLMSTALDEYPGCSITDLSKLASNSEECGWDAGDCVLKKYPNCHVSFPSRIGDGVCDGVEYNTVLCQWDGGDCSSENNQTVRSLEDDRERSGVETAGIVFGAMVVVALIILSQFLFIRSRNRYSNIVASADARPTRRIVPSGDLFGALSPAALFVRGSLHPVRTSKAKREQRIALVMDSIIRKKVFLKSTRRDDKLRVLPRKEVITFRSSKQATDNGIILMGNSSQHSMMKVDDESSNAIDEEAVGYFEKDDIYIDGSSMHSSRQNIITDNSLHSFRRCLNMTSSSHTMDKHGDSIYSPRSCPVCYEDYKKGDDIAWSKNEDCLHAYHAKCILEWLMENDDCPMCRSDYLKSGGSSQNSDFPIAIPPEPSVNDV